MQADLRIVRRGAAFLITSREHADALFQEAMEKERAKIELQRFRLMPPPRPEPPSPQPKPEQPLPVKDVFIPPPKPHG